MKYQKTLLPDGKTRPPESEFSDTGTFHKNPQSGVNINTGEISQPKTAVDIPNKEEFNFSFYREYPGPNPESGKDVRKK